MPTDRNAVPQLRASRWATATLALLTIAYPLAVYFALPQVGVRGVAALLAGLALLRAWVSPHPMWLAAAFGAGALAMCAGLFGAALPLKLYPVLVNAVLAFVFGASLCWPPSAIERLARLREPDLPPRAVRYTRKVTWIWLIFFLCNGMLAFATAMWASDAVWALYNGGIAYVLIGLVFAIEWLVRQRVRRMDADA